MNNIYYTIGVINLLLLSAMSILAVVVLIEKCKEKGLMFFGLYTFVSLIVQTIMVVLAIKEVDNIFIYHFYLIFEYATLAFVLQAWVEKYKYSRYLIIAFVAVVISTSLTPLNLFPVESLLISSIVLSAFSARAVFLLRKKLTIG